MSNKDRSKWDYFLRKPLTEFLNLVAYLKADADNEARMMEDQINKMRR